MKIVSSVAWLGISFGRCRGLSPPRRGLQSSVNMLLVVSFHFVVVALDPLCPHSMYGVVVRMLSLVIYGEGILYKAPGLVSLLSRSND